MNGWRITHASSNVSTRTNLSRYPACYNKSSAVTSLKSSSDWLTSLLYPPE